MKLRTSTLLLTCAALLAGCATKEFVTEQVGNSTLATNKRVDGVAADLSGRIDRQGQDAQARIKELDGRLTTQQNGIDGASRTAQEALERARAAGKLAEGKFLYEVSLSSQIAFPFDSSELTKEAQTALDEFAQKLKSENRNVFLEIQGHTDSLGSEAANLKIGEARAEGVRRYLAMKGGIALHRMSVISYGETAPIASNKTREGRIQNRRVTLVVLQ